jgi:hypothetical protein
MKSFWREFVKGDNSIVHTPYAAMAIAFVLATPIITLSTAAIIYHVFLKGKGLDAPTVQLLLGMLGAATGGVVSAGVSMFSKITTSQVTSIGSLGDTPPTAKKAPPIGDGL